MKAAIAAFATTIMASFVPGCLAVEHVQAAEFQTIQFEGSVWESHNATQLSVKKYLGIEALHVLGNNSTYVSLPDVKFQEGTIELDMAMALRSPPGIMFHGSPGKDRNKVFVNFLPGRENADAIKLEQVVVTQKEGTTIILNVRKAQRDAPRDRSDLGDWIHVRLDFHGKMLSVFLDGNHEPCIELASIFDIRNGSIGVCGGNCYFANLRVAPRKNSSGVDDLSSLTGKLGMVDPVGR